MRKVGFPTWNGCGTPSLFWFPFEMLQTKLVAFDLPWATRKHKFPGNFGPLLFQHAEVHGPKRLPGAKPVLPCAESSPQYSQGPEQHHRRPSFLSRAQQPSQSHIDPIRPPRTSQKSEMGKVAMDVARRKMFAKAEMTRNVLKSIVMSSRLPATIRQVAQQRLAEMPANTAATRIRMRCVLTGRPRAVDSRTGLSRIAFRELASNGKLPGIWKAR